MSRAMRGAGMAVVGVAAAVLLTSAVPAAVDDSYFRVSLTGSVGPLHIGMTRAAARRYLHFSAYGFSRAGVSCAQYDAGIGARRGSVGACFDRARHLIALGVSGPVFCFGPTACVDGHDVIPRSVRARFRTLFDSRNGTYVSRLRDASEAVATRWCCRGRHRTGRRRRERLDLHAADRTS
jgi:hypothetical protein